MKYIWATGLLAAGQASTMTGTYTGQFVMSGFLDMQIPMWMRAAVTRSVALVPTMIIAVLFSGGNSLDTLQQRLNVLQSFQLPFALVPVIYVTTRVDVMGPRFVTRRFFKYGAFAVTTLLLLLNGATVISVIGDAAHTTASKVGLFTLLTVYLLMVLYLLIGPCLVGRALDKWGGPRMRKAFGWLAQEGVIHLPPLEVGAMARKWCCFCFERREPGTAIV
jgi:natural resistance-associated macrophage protein 2